MTTVIFILPSVLLMQDIRTFAGYHLHYTQNHSYIRWEYYSHLHVKKVKFWWFRTLKPADSAEWPCYLACRWSWREICPGAIFSSQIPHRLSCRVKNQ